MWQVAGTCCQPWGQGHCTSLALTARLLLLLGVMLSVSRPSQG